MNRIDLSDLFFATYEENGRGNGLFDCFGLFSEICRRRGIELPPHPTPESLEDRQAAILAGAKDWKRLEAPEPWCGVAIRVGRYVAHMGVVLWDGTHFIHANKKSGVTRSRLDEPAWAKRIYGYYRHE